MPRFSLVSLSDLRKDLLLPSTSQLHGSTDFELTPVLGAAFPRLLLLASVAPFSDYTR